MPVLQIFVNNLKSHWILQDLLTGYALQVLPLDRTYIYIERGKAVFQIKDFDIKIRVSMDPDNEIGGEPASEDPKTFLLQLFAHLADA